MSGVRQVIQATFIAYRSPVDFISRMESLIDGIKAAEARKFGAQSLWIGNTAYLVENPHIIRVRLLGACEER